MYLMTALVGLLANADDVCAEIRLYCPSQMEALHQQVVGYLQQLDISPGQVTQKLDPESGLITLSLTTPPNDTSTLDLFLRPEYALSFDQVRLPTENGKTRTVSVVSKKEILLALLQHGRVTEFKDSFCSLEALIDDVAVRQNIVAWAQTLNWVWPNGRAAKWNRKYWIDGTPKPGVSIQVALRDTFFHQRQYSIGCYTATKLVVVQGILDYYRRVKHDSHGAERVERALESDGDPLVGIEPAKMWKFEADFDIQDMNRPGKLMEINSQVAAGNFVPGDWIYLLNTDAVTYQKTGYEGSNALYLGRNRFDDYFNDNAHSYTYEQKLDEVYQWRNGVFSRSRDARKIKLLTSKKLADLRNTPSDGGIQLDIRVEPMHF